MSLLVFDKLKLVSSVGMAGMSVVSVPTTLSLTINRSPSEFVGPLNSGISTAQQWMSKQFGGFDKKLEKEYEDFGEKTVENMQEGHTITSETLEGFKNSAKDPLKFINDKQEDINYYVFTVGDIVKAVIRQIPVIVRDSIIEAQGEADDKQLLSVQKVQAIINSDKFSNFLSGVMTALATHSQTLSNISAKDADGVLQIFRELTRQKIGDFLEGVKSNSESLDGKESYCNASKLILHLLVGKSKMNGMSTTITELTSKLDNMKDDLSDIFDSLGVDFDNIKSQLNSISNSKTIKDPCDTSSS